MLRMKGTRISLGTVTLALLSSLSVTAVNACLSPQAVGGAAAAPGARTYGKTLTEWMTGYWTWYYGAGVNTMEHAPLPYQPGPQPVVFMPMPGWGDAVQTGGNWMPDDPAIMVGEIHVTLRAGTRFVTPFFGWTAERYEGWPGVPDDGMIPGNRIRDAMIFPSGAPGSVPEIMLDGKPLVRDFWSQYVGEVLLATPILYPTPSDYGSVGVVGYQSAGVVVHPLPVGRHVLHLYEQWRLTPDITPPGWEIGLVYDNTWIIDVVPGYD